MPYSRRRCRIPLDGQTVPSGGRTAPDLHPAKPDRRAQEAESCPGVLTTDEAGSPEAEGGEPPATAFIRSLAGTLLCWRVRSLEGRDVAPRAVVLGPEPLGSSVIVLPSRRQPAPRSRGKP